VRDVSPEFLINAAGYVGRPNVDACELNREECIKGNVVLPVVVRDVCQQLRLPWGHVSSGCIYSGRREDGRGFTEEDPPNFTFENPTCSFYSGCKALAESMLKEAGMCYVWRLRMPFDHIDSDRNLLSKLMRYDRLLDVHNSLTHLGQFVDACLDCWQRRLSFGTYNLTCSGALSTRETVEMIQRSGVCRKEFAYFASEEEFLQQAAVARRSCCELDNRKAVQGGLRLRDVAVSVWESLSAWTRRTEH
jgi:UDP-glucose 4,6-dehydratase